MADYRVDEPGRFYILWKQRAHPIHPDSHGSSTQSSLNPHLLFAQCTTGSNKHPNPHNPNLRPPRPLHLPLLIPNKPQLHPKRRNRLLRPHPNPPLSIPHPRIHRTHNLLHRHHLPNRNPPHRAPNPLLLHLQMPILQHAQH